MAHFLVSDDRYRDLIYDDDHRSRRFDQRNPMRKSPGDYRFGRAHGRPTHGSLSRVNGTLERELELRGIRPCDKG